MKLFGKLVAGATLGMSLLGGAAFAQSVEGPEVFWRISMWGNPRALSAGMEAMAEHVLEETGGNFRIQIFYGGQLSSARENLDGLAVNAFEGAAICNFYHPGRNPAWMVFSLPFLPLGDPEIDRQVRARLMEHPAIVADMARWNAMPYVSGLLPQYEILGRGDAPTDLSDWNGLRVRAGGGLGSAMEALGAVRQSLPAGETSTAFQRGAIDAAAFPFTYAHVAFGIDEEADWFTSNLTPGTSECGWVLNRTAYDALPPQYQDLLMSQRERIMEIQQAAYAAQDEINLPAFRENLVEVIYSDDQLEEFREVAGRPVWEAWIAENQDDFDAQGLFDAVWEYAAEAEAAQ
ncbi:C4-dicarboxylate ABC transporter substrate-binding protein [Nioella aestuarii]|uniref:C4-dicarboxylate ABC transporter substrate-binding protein n=1 Tax=Nioella aestuarii TaxID=1662864 RepID=UPI003D7FBCA9